MSYSVSLVGDDGRLVQVPDREAVVMDVAYNFVHLFAKCGFCLLSFHGVRAVRLIPTLRAAVMRLGTDCDPDDPRKPAAGNAGYALALMLCWAIQHPQATWRVR